MKHKLILTVGGVLIATVTVIASLLYYFNKDHTCPRGTFLCAGSTKCLEQKYQCNNFPECPHGDDEDDCTDLNEDFSFLDENFTTQPCHMKDERPPENCSYEKCTATCQYWNEIPQTLSVAVMGLIMQNSSVEELNPTVLDKYDKLQTLDLSFNGIRELHKGVFKKLNILEVLSLSGNEITVISPGHLKGLQSIMYFHANENELITADLSDLNGCTSLSYIKLCCNSLSELILPELPGLKEIDLSDNRLDIINETLFHGCPALKTLNVANNNIKSIETGAFKNFFQLTELNLNRNQIIRLQSDTFSSASTVRVLWLGNNPLEELPESFFALASLKSLHFEDLKVTYGLRKNAFDGFEELEFVYFTKFHFCATYAANVKKCKPTSDGVSSMSHLLGKSLLQAAVWGISTVTCVGNILVLWGRFTARDENRVLSIVIRHLAVADMLMGVYLLGIAIQDVRFRENYKKEASSWMSSVYCTALGALGMTSSVVSLFILSFMSVERFLVIVPPLSHRETPRPIALMMMCVFWLVGITIAIGPAIYWWNSTKFYGINGMCFPLYIDDPYMVGWEYSAFVSIGVNLLGLLIIATAYIAMFASICRTQRATPLPVSDSEFALRLFFIVFTNAICWTPIIALKVVAMSNYPVPPDLHAWVVTFFVPINSAVNPLLYTFTTTRFKERLSGGWFGRMRNYFSASLERQGSQISTVEKNNYRMTYQTSNEEKPVTFLTKGIEKFLPNHNHRYQ